MREKLQTVVIETPEHYELQFRLAGIGTRFVAYLIDKAVQLLLLFVLVTAAITTYFALGRVFPRVPVPEDLIKLLGRWLLAAAILMYGLATGGYFILFEYLWSGSTPGKRLQGIRVIRKDGRPITFVDTAIRNILRFVDILAEVYPIGLVVMFLDSRNRRLGDLTAGTLVVMDEAVNAPSAPDQAVAGPEDIPEVRYAVNSMTPNDYRIVVRFLARREGLEQEHRADLARKLCLRLLAKSDAALPVGSDPELFLERIAASYQERTRVL
ncbi:MAG: RDD family protein [Desulfomonile sp.]|nr:RDD family protein [Desulfomonile sp.]